MIERLNYIPDHNVAISMRDKKVHPPMRSVKELADEFGITARYLNALMLKKSDLEPYLVTGIGLHKKYYYVLADARKWWAERKKEKQHVSS